MDKFYKRLSLYNSNLTKKEPSLPEWFLQYTSPKPPLYWRVVGQMLHDEDRSQRIVEVGAGCGDVTALLCWMGFEKVTAIERDPRLVKIVLDKLDSLGESDVVVLNALYPIKLDFKPDIIVQVNCIYSDRCIDKESFLKSVLESYEYNGIPKVFLFEAIDESYIGDNPTFPAFVRIGLKDIKKLFPNCKIYKQTTYLYPTNRVTKVMYKICA